MNKQLYVQVSVSSGFSHLGKKFIFAILHLTKPFLYCDFLKYNINLSENLRPEPALLCREYYFPFTSKVGYTFVDCICIL